MIMSAAFPIPVDEVIQTNRAIKATYTHPSSFVVKGNEYYIVGLGRRQDGIHVTYKCDKTLQTMSVLIDGNEDQRSVEKSIQEYVETVLAIESDVEEA